MTAGSSPFDEVGRPAVALEQVLQLLVGDARQQRRVVDLVAVEMQDRQHRAVADGIEKLVGMPRRRQRPGLGFAVADHHRHQQVRIVEGGAEGVRDAVAELAALVDGARRLRRAVAADAAGEGEFLEELAHALLVLALVRIDLRVGALQIDRRQHARRAVARAGQEDRVEVVLVDQAVEVNVGEAQAGTRAPVPEQAQLDVLGLAAARAAADCPAGRSCRRPGSCRRASRRLGCAALRRTVGRRSRCGCRLSSSASHQYACLPWVLSFLRASCTEVLCNGVDRYAPATVHTAWIT